MVFNTGVQASMMLHHLARNRKSQQKSQQHHSKKHHKQKVITQTQKELQIKQTTARLKKQFKRKNIAARLKF